MDAFIKYESGTAQDASRRDPRYKDGRSVASNRERAQEVDGGTKIMTYKPLSYVRTDLGYYRTSEILFAMVLCTVVMGISIIYYVMALRATGVL